MKRSDSSDVGGRLDQAFVGGVVDDHVVGSVTKDEPYHDLGAAWLARRNGEARSRRLVAQLERLGRNVQLDAVA